MQRLQSGVECDEEIRRELRAAGIRAGCDKPGAEGVISSVTGQMGRFTLRRFWCHWAVDGLVPLEVARELHADPVARKGLRVGGHYGHPAPGQFATVWINPAGDLRLPLGDKEEAGGSLATRYPAAQREVERGAAVEFVADPALGGRGFVDGYHIDTEEALLLFAQTMRRHDLA